MNRVYIGLGSNVGDRRGNIRRALELLGRVEGVSILGVSSLYETEPVGYEEQGRFINAAAEGETELTPHELLARLKGIERDMGRETPFRWGPRNIDLDLLFYGEEVVRTADLTIPHPSAEERLFVMEPLAELAPDGVHPVSGRTFREIADGLACGGGVEKLEDRR
jgi:2-amino-4-hydroxy-6-hydroxymethyldihydropteridine diphosphokinase